jgi:exodeoxyribonuclease V alpha subunit
VQVAPATEHTSIRGEVERVFYSSAGFSAGLFITDTGERVQFAGSIVASEHQPLVLSGGFIKHPKYGRQFQAVSMEFDRRPDVRGLANYLANNPEIKGIGPAKAKILAEGFGSDFESALTARAEDMARAAHLPLSVIEDLRDHWLRTRDLNSAMAVLAGYGLTHYQITKLIKKLGNNAVGAVERDPYVLIHEIDGFGFKRVDKIARQVGVAKDAPSRIRAGIVSVVSDALDAGDCWVEYEDLIHRSNKLLIMDALDSRERIEFYLDQLIDEESLSCFGADSRFLVAIPSIRRMEESLAITFGCGKNTNPWFEDLERLDSLVRDTSPDLTDRQREAVVAVCRHRISLITGGAGSGKTFTIKAITDVCDARGLSVVLCAPTGKAAKRMEQSAMRPASTIHRLLGFDGTDYARDREDPVPADMLIVDEASMIDVSLAWRLFEAVDISRTSVVLVGDHNQLPPVGPGNILRDLIDSRAVPTVVLDDIIRQAGLLKENSIAILRGEVPETPHRESADFGTWFVADQHTEPERVQKFLLAQFEQTLSEKLGFDLLRDVQVLTPTHKGPLGTVELNTRLQRLIQRKLWDCDVPAAQPGRRPKLLVNDKVIQTRNNYEIGVMNGAMGIVRRSDPNGALSVEFEDKVVNIEAGSPHRADLSLAYALTIHKAQGSEFPCSIVIAHKSHSFMHHRNLLYTGVTRARKTAIIIGDRWGISTCAKRVQVDERKTFLSLLLQGGAS